MNIQTNGNETIVKRTSLAARGLILSAAALVCATAAAPQAYAGGASAPAGAIAPTEVFQVRATTLTARDAQEEGFASDGDEPYVVYALVKPGGALGVTLSVERSRRYEDIDDGDQRTPNVELMRQNVRAKMGVAAQVVENDGESSGGVITSMRNAANTAFTNAINAGTRDACALAGVVARALHNAAAHDNGWFEDDDDVIGAGASFCVPVADLDSLGVGRELGRNLQFRGDGANYLQRFTIRRTE